MVRTLCYFFVTKNILMFVHDDMVNTMLKSEQNPEREPHLNANRIYLYCKSSNFIFWNFIHLITCNG